MKINKKRFIKIPQTHFLIDFLDSKILLYRQLVNFPIGHHYITVLSDYRTETVQSVSVRNMRKLKICM